MQRKALRGGRLASGAYDERSNTLEIGFSDGSVRVYAGVPAEVWRRLLSAPNAASYFEDRIADEYPSQPGSAAPDEAAKGRLDALFGAPPATRSDPAD
ncbi:MAG: KTSC domain-containing protein [Burkholderiaceae bacterium]|nr:KTSC domain-containing protein [Burkholderiaceae bacterium]